MSVTRIAEKAGVSIATVSRVLNKSRPVNPEMARLVHQAVEELQLSPQPLRKRQRSRGKGKAGRDSSNAGTIAIVALGQHYRRWFEVPVIAEVIAELTRAAQEQHVAVLMTEMLDPTKLSTVLKRPEVGGALAFVDASLNTRDVVALTKHLPVVRIMGGQFAPVDVDHVGPDNNAVGFIAADYLLDRGLRQMAFFSCNPAWDITRLRAQGFLARLSDEEIRPTMLLKADRDGAFLDFYGRNVVVDAEPAALLRRLVEPAKSGPVGLFVARDEEAVIAYQALAAAGLEPGRDVVVVSCDNETTRLSTLRPRPASIDLDAATIAKHAITRIRNRIRTGDERPRRMLVNPHLVPGDA